MFAILLWVKKVVESDILGFSNYVLKVIDIGSLELHIFINQDYTL